VKRGTIMMIVGLDTQTITWVFSLSLSNLSDANSNLNLIKPLLGYGSIFGWMVFFTGLGIRQLDKKKILIESKREKLLK
jgi:hypothetical protein